MKIFLLYLLLSASLIDNIYSAPTKKKNKKTSQRKKSGKKSKSGKSGKSGSGGAAMPITASAKDKSSEEKNKELANELLGTTPVVKTAAETNEDKKA